MSTNSYDVVVNVKETGAEDAKKKISDLNDAVKKTPGHTKEFSEAFKDAKEHLGGMTDKLPPAVTGFGELASSMKSPIAAAGLLTGALVGLAPAIAAAFSEQIANLDHTAEKMGITINEASALNSVLKDYGLGADAVQAAGDKLAKSMVKAGDTTKGVGEAFTNLGITYKDNNGHLLDTNDVMEKLAEKYHEGTLNAGELGAMEKVLGSNFREQILAFEAGKVAAEEHNAAIAAGIGITQAAQKAVKDQETAQRDMGRVFQSIGSIMVELVVPGFTKLIGKFTESYKEGGFVATAVNYIGEAFYGVGNVIKFVMEQISALVDMFKLVTNVGSNIATSLVQLFVERDWQAAKDTMNHAFDGFGSGMVNALAKSGNASIQLAKDIASGIGKTLGAIPLENFVGASKAAVQNEGVRMDPNKPFRATAGGDPIMGATPEKIDPIIALIASLTKELAVKQQLNKADETSALLLTDKYKDGSNLNKQLAMTKAGEVDLAAAHKLVDDSIKGSKNTLRDYINSLKDEQLQLTMGSRDYKAMLEDQKLDIQMNEAIAQLDQQHIGFEKEKNRLIEENTRLKKENHAATDIAKLGDQDWMKGINVAIKDYSENADNMFKQSRDVATSAFKTMEDGLVSFAMTGKLNFADMAKSIIADLIRIQVRAALSGIFKMIGTAIIGAYTGVSTDTSVGARASGGPVNPGSTYVVGENGPELLTMGTQGGSITPNSQLQQSNRGLSVGNITIVVQGGQTNDQTGAALSKALMDTFTKIADGRIANAKRVGGLLHA